jgi:hypothetical protein
MTIWEHFQRDFKRITYCAVGAWLQNAGVGPLLGAPLVAVVLQLYALRV